MTSTLMTSGQSTKDTWLLLSLKTLLSDAYEQGKDGDSSQAHGW